MPNTFKAKTHKAINKALQQRSEGPSTRGTRLDRLKQIEHERCRWKTVDEYNLMVNMALSMHKCLIDHMVDQASRRAISSDLTVLSVTTNGKVFCLKKLQIPYSFMDREMEREVKVKMLLSVEKSTERRSFKQWIKGGNELDETIKVNELEWKQKMVKWGNDGSTELTNSCHRV